MLVAHSYGGFVITNAATGNPNVKALVYIDAFVPDANETALDLVGGTTSCVNDNGAFSPVPFNGGLRSVLELGSESCVRRIPSMLRQRRR